MQHTAKKQLIDSIIHLLSQRFDEDLSKDSNLYASLNQTIQSVFSDSDSIEAKEVTVLLSDLRGFTPMAEKYSPLEVINLLNRYFSKMSQIILAYGGTIDKFMGDAIMALFGAPETRDSDLERALACAIEMQLAMKEINSHNQQIGLPAIYMGIGINTGTVVAGNLGSHLHSEYTVIGDEVNLASRVEAHSLRGQILLSQNTYQAAQSYITIGQVNSVKVKGKAEPVKMYELLQTNRPKPLIAPLNEFRKSPRVNIESPLAFKRIVGKTVLAEEYTGKIIDIGYGGIFAVSPIELHLHDDIKITLSLSLMGHNSTDIYARVLRVNQFESSYECNLEFTVIDDEAQNAIKEFVDHEVERM